MSKSRNIALRYNLIGCIAFHKMTVLTHAKKSWKAKIVDVSDCNISIDIF